MWQYLTQDGSPNLNNLIDYKAIDASTDMIVATSGSNYINYNMILSSSYNPYYV